MDTTTKPLVVEMAFAKSTKGTHVFTTTDPGAAVTQIYVQKSALGPTPPPKLTLTIAAATEGDS
jgi:hypothetical protein